MENIVLYSFFFLKVWSKHNFWKNTFAFFLLNRCFPVLLFH